MLKFIFHKLLNKKWMVVSLFIGNLLMIAIACANPMYSRAVLQRTLTQDLSDYLLEKNRCPGAIMVKNEYSSYIKNEFSVIDQIDQKFEELIETLNVPAMETVVSFTQSNVSTTNVLKVEGQTTEFKSQLSAYEGIEDHIKMKYGQLFSSEVNEHVIEVIVNERTFVDKNLLLGSELELRLFKDENDVPYRIKVVGIFESSVEDDPYWSSAPDRTNNTFIMSEEVFRQLIANPEREKTSFSVNWYTVLDYTKIEANKVGEMLQITSDFRKNFERIDKTTVHFNYEDTLKAFVPKAQKLNTTITVLQMPIFMLLAAFIFMVSGQMLEMEQNEISVFKSRGASKSQIIRLYLQQSVMIALFSLIGGIFLGVMVCKMLGASNAFLEFVQRKALPVKIDQKAILFAVVAAMFSICTMVLPVFKFAGISIVAHKRQKNRTKTRTWWKLVGLDIILLVISIYGFYRFKGQEEYLATQVVDGVALDPVLYACSSLFMLGAGLLILRILPLLIKIIFQIGKKWWSPAVYASFLRILRTNNNQGFLVVFLILTVAMGIFSTQTARTINTNAEERIRYSIGADVVLQERWKDNKDILAEDNTGLLELSYYEPDYGKYLEMEGIDKATKVLVQDTVKVTVEGGKLSNVMVMGIHTKEFGQVAWFKDNLLSAHWYQYLNVISQNSSAVLVSSNFRDMYGYEVGDILNYTNENGDTTRGIIYGFVDYWPSYASVTIEQDKDGLYKQKDNFLIIAHLSQLQSSWGIMPYQIWIKTAESSGFLYDYAEETGTRFEIFKDTAAEIVELKNDPVFQGTNGILTIGFIIVLLLCATGFLIYWILSIQSRTLQFGIFRAMGMSKREILTMLITEQIFISGNSILSGVVVGQLGSKLFVPLIQIAYSSVDRVIPLEIISETNDYLRLMVVIGFMIVVCMMILGVLISKIKITQALKLGED